EWARWAVLAGVVALFGALGTPEDQTIVDRAVVVPQLRPLTSDMVIRALAHIGIARLTEAAAQGSGAIRCTAPITRDGHGYRADVELPYGVTVAEVMDKRDKLAAALRRPLGSVWPEQAPDEHPGRLTLFVGDKDM